MKIVRGLRNLEHEPRNPVVALGNFDGVHLGHKAILERTTQRAKEAKGDAVVYTFEPHPLKILAPEQSISLLTTFKQKMELIAGNDIAYTICADFNRNFARMHPKEFIKLLMDGLAMSRVVVGHDYSFGHGKAGTIDSLKHLGGDLGFDVEVVDALEVYGDRVSSTIIRATLYEGDVEKASKLLGRYYSIAGKVVSGYQRGKAIGFPTANLQTPYEVIPEVGIYAVYVKIGGGERRRGVVNIGYNPTFDRDDFIVEAHLLDVSEDIYGAEVEVFFVKRLRDEMRFDSVDELKAQIEKDVIAAKQALK